MQIFRKQKRIRDAKIHKKSHLTEVVARTGSQILIVSLEIRAPEYRKVKNIFFFVNELCTNLFKIKIVTKLRKGQRCSIHKYIRALCSIFDIGT